MDQLPSSMIRDQSHSGEPRDKLPPFWTSQVSRSTGHRYYHNSVTNQSTYSLEEVYRAPLTIVKPVVPAPINTGDVRCITDMVGMAAKFSVAELQMMLG